jgi:hypothetical protein
MKQQPEPVTGVAKVEYWIPVIATVDLDRGEVVEVDQWPDELGSCIPSVTVDGDQPPTHIQDQALAIAEGSEWPERNTH